MKKIITAILFILLLPAFTFSEVIKKTTQEALNGLPKEITFYNDNKEVAKEVFDEKGNAVLTGTIPDGIVKEFYEKRKITIFWSYKNGKKDGITKMYYDNGKLCKEENYTNGKPEGSQKAYYENGILRFDEIFKDGKRNGFRNQYYKNGQLKREEKYLNGEQDFAKTYYKDGKIKTIETFKNGNPFNSKVYNEEGKLKMDLDSGYFPKKYSAREKEEQIEILKKWLIDNTIKIELPTDLRDNYEGPKEVTSGITITDINKAIEKKYEEENDETMTSQYNENDKNIEVKTITLGKGTPEFAFFVTHGTVGWRGDLWKINNDKSLEYAIELGGWHSRIFFIDLDNDGVQEIINTEGMLGAGELNLLKYGIDFRGGMTKVYKWKDKKFITIGCLFDIIEIK